MDALGSRIWILAILILLIAPLFVVAQNASEDTDTQLPYDKVQGELIELNKLILFARQDAQLPFVPASVLDSLSKAEQLHDFAASITTPNASNGQYAQAMALISQANGLAAHARTQALDWKNYLVISGGIVLFIAITLAYWFLREKLQPYVSLPRIRPR